MKLTFAELARIHAAGYSNVRAISTHGGLGIEVVGIKNGKLHFVSEDLWTPVAWRQVQLGAAPAAKAIPPAPAPTPAECEPMKPVAVPAFEAPVPCPKPVSPRPVRQTPFMAAVAKRETLGTWGNEADIAAFANVFRARVDVFEPGLGGLKHVGVFRPADRTVVRHVSLLRSGDSHFDLLRGRDVIKQPGDGNCLYHSLAAAVGGVHQAMRSKLNSWLRGNGAKQLPEFGNMRLDDYVTRNG